RRRDNNLASKNGLASGTAQSSNKPMVARSSANSRAHPAHSSTCCRTSAGKDCGVRSRSANFEFTFWQFISPPARQLVLRNILGDKVLQLFAQCLVGAKEQRFGGGLA